MITELLEVRMMSYIAKKMPNRNAEKKIEKQKLLNAPEPLHYRCFEKISIMSEPEYYLKIKP